MNIKTANRLCELRKKHNLSQEELADKLGVSRQAVSKWERSESSPDTDNLIQLAKLYGISLDELLNGDDAIDIIEEKLQKQKQTVIEKQQKLKLIERKINNRLRQIKDAQNSDFDVIKLVQSHAGRMVLMEGPLKLESMFDMETPIRKLEQSQAQGVVFLGKVGVGISEEHLREGRYEVYDKYFLLLDDEEDFVGRVISFPQTLCASVRFRGIHNEAAQQYRRLNEYIEDHDLEINGFSREITMIDYGITSDTEKFVTEISIPVASS